MSYAQGAYAGEAGDGGAYVNVQALSRLRAATQTEFESMPRPVAARPERAEGERLVPYKTKQGDVSLVSFGKSVLAERRVARLKRSVWASGHLHKLADAGFRPPVCWFVTLTYAKSDAWEALHIREAVERFRQWCRRADVACRYTWVAEIQPKRCERTGKAVVHYHLLAWLPVGVEMPEWGRKASRRHSKFWEHGRCETEIARSGVGYLMKYLSKLGEFHRFPKGLRLYGIGGLVSEGRAVRSWFNLPEWAKCLHGVGDLCRKAGGLVVRATGEILASPYVVRLVPGGLEVRLVGTVPDRFHDGAYSTLTRGFAC